jgi:hypothetical protein
MSLAQTLDNTPHTKHIAQAFGPNACIVFYTYLYLLLF